MALEDVALPHLERERPHELKEGVRLQLVREASGMRFYNDSKSTTPEATGRAVDSFDDPQRIHLIAGGYDKGVDLGSIAKRAAALAGLYAIGTTSMKLVEHAPRDTSVFACDTLDRAVATAIARMKPGDILLLSPGCASWDQFTNFEQRGNAFMQHVEVHFERGACGA